MQCHWPSLNHRGCQCATQSSWFKATCPMARGEGQFRAISSRDAATARRLGLYTTPFCILATPFQAARQHVPTALATDAAATGQSIPCRVTRPPTVTTCARSCDRSKRWEQVPQAARHGESTRNSNFGGSSSNRSPSQPLAASEETHCPLQASATLTLTLTDGQHSTGNRSSSNRSSAPGGRTASAASQDRCDRHGTCTYRTHLGRQQLYSRSPSQQPAAMCKAGGGALVQPPASSLLQASAALTDGQPPPRFGVRESDCKPNGLRRNNTVTTNQVRSFWPRSFVHDDQLGGARCSATSQLWLQRATTGANSLRPPVATSTPPGHGPPRPRQARSLARHP